MRGSGEQNFQSSRLSSFCFLLPLGTGCDEGHPGLGRWRGQGLEEVFAVGRQAGGKPQGPRCQGAQPLPVSAPARLSNLSPSRHLRNPPCISHTKVSRRRQHQAYEPKRSIKASVTMTSGRLTTSRQRRKTSSALVSKGERQPPSADNPRLRRPKVLPSAPYPNPLLLCRW